jgi:hypothetical protein
MSPSFRKYAKTVGLLILGFVILAAIVASFCSFGAVSDIAHLVLIPGAIVDSILSRNIHAGFGIDWLDCVVTVIGSWLFFMLPACLVIWAFTGKSKSSS